RVHRRSVRRARSRVVQPAQAAPEAAAQPLRVLSAGDRGWWVGWLDGPPGRSVECRRSLCDPRPGGRQLLHGGHESLPQGGLGAEELVVYSGRKEIVVKPVVEAFQKMTGVAVKLKIGPTSGLANALIQEKARPRADVFLATEAGVMEILAKSGVLDAYVSPESKGLLPGTSEREGVWTGMS